MKYLLDQRMRNAQILLETSDLTITEIAHSLGYENSMYFSRVFRKAKVQSPSKYRKTYRDKLIDNS